MKIGITLFALTALLYSAGSIFAEPSGEHRSETHNSGSVAGLIPQEARDIVSVRRGGINTFSTGGPGSLDSTFGIEGVDTLDPLGGTSNGRGIALQSDGKIIVAGTSQSAAINSADVFSVARFDSNGTVDNTFGDNGSAAASINEAGQYGYAEGKAVAVQPDGKIVVAGYSYDQTNASAFGIARFNSNGTIDTTFGVYGSLRIVFNANGGDFARSVVIQPDGKIIVAGRSSVIVNDGGSSVEQYFFAAARLTQEGKLDSTFGSNGTVTILAGGDSTSFEGTSVALQPDGKILIGGYGTFSHSALSGHFIVARLDSNGTLDGTFGNGGISILSNIGGPAGSSDVCNAIAVQADGKILLAGSSDNYPAIARLNSDGSPDSSFGKGGSETIHLSSSLYGYTDWSCNSVCLQSDGKIVVGGTNETAGSQLVSFALGRLNQNGSPDPAFADSGWCTNGYIPSNAELPGYGYFSIKGIKIAPDGKIIACGTTTGSNNENTFIVARFLTASTSTAVSSARQLPGSFQLSQNYPNPFNPTTAISYELSANSFVTLKVYDVLGRRMETLVNGKETPGEHMVEFDGSRLASGVYFYRLTASGNNGRRFVSVRKMLELK